jgi:hypothetical protein
VGQDISLSRYIPPAVPRRLGAIVCSIEVQPNITYYVKYVTDLHCSRGLSHLRRCPTSAEVGLLLSQEEGMYMEGFNTTVVTEAEN